MLTYDKELQQQLDHEHPLQEHQHNSNDILDLTNTINEVIKNKIGDIPLDRTNLKHGWGLGYNQKTRSFDFFPYGDESIYSHNKLKDYKKEEHTTLDDKIVSSSTLWSSAKTMKSINLLKDVIGELVGKEIEDLKKENEEVEKDIENEKQSLDKRIEIIANAIKSTQSKVNEELSNYSKQNHNHKDLLDLLKGKAGLKHSHKDLEKSIKEKANKEHSHKEFKELSTKSDIKHTHNDYAIKNHAHTELEQRIDAKLDKESIKGIESSIDDLAKRDSDIEQKINDIPKYELPEDVVRKEKLDLELLDKANLNHDDINSEL